MAFASFRIVFHQMTRTQAELAKVFDANALAYDSKSKAKRSEVSARYVSMGFVKCGI